MHSISYFKHVRPTKTVHPSQLDLNQLRRPQAESIPITDTLLKLIAAAASIGLNSTPKNG